MSQIIGAPNVYSEIEWRTIKVADQSELPAAFQEAIKDGWFPFQQAFGKMENELAVKPVFYVLTWRPKVNL